ncbi:MAG: radical SAM protein [Patescibacteria group bacterium]|jgi:MoaA/NifB/PqqE/SkfB family radical SAM enzyme
MFNAKKLKKYGLLGLRKLKHNFKTWFYMKTGWFLPPPEKVYFLLSNKCNYQCKMCPQWKQGISENADEYIPIGRVKGIIDEMKKLGIGELGISGGEPLIYKEKTLELLGYANKNGIYTHFATNGSLLDEEILAEYNRAGGGHISLSVDGMGEKHDALRGFSGAYVSVERALKLFRENNYSNIALKINFVLSGENLDEALLVAGLAIKNSALIFFQPYDPYDFGNRDIEKKETSHALWVKKENYGKLRVAMDGLMELKKKNPGVILNDLEHLNSFYDYFTDNKFHKTCYAGMDQIAINPFGKVIFCKFGEIADLKNISLANYLKSEKRKNIVQASLACEESCLLGCMFRPGAGELFINGAKRVFKLMAK